MAAASKLLGPGARLVGGAAGDDLEMKATWVGANDQVATDAVVLAALFSARPLGIGVHHGHSPLSRPLKVTRAEGNTVAEIDGQPAWDVWREQTREHALSSGIDPDALQAADVGAFLLRYEAGIAVGTELQIRAPLSLGPNGSINFACGIPQGSLVRITESTAPRQISSARAAARLARGGLPTKYAGAIVFDCICRNLILGSQFATAVRGISEELGGAPLAGFETYGEIALDVGDKSGFHNTTTVVLSFPA